MYVGSDEIGGLKYMPVLPAQKLIAPCPRSIQCANCLLIIFGADDTLVQGDPCGRGMLSVDVKIRVPSG